MENSSSITLATIGLVHTPDVNPYATAPLSRISESLFRCSCNIQGGRPDLCPSRMLSIPCSCQFRIQMHTLEGWTLRMSAISGAVLPSMFSATAWRRLAARYAPSRRAFFAQLNQPLYLFPCSTNLYRSHSTSSLERCYYNTCSLIYTPYIVMLLSIDNSHV